MLPIAVPVPTFRRATGEVDLTVTERYAEALRATWARTIVVAGPAGLGEDCTDAERADQRALWQQHSDRFDIVAACWTPQDFAASAEHGLRQLAMLRAGTGAELIDALIDLPTNTIAYANPRYSPALLAPDVLLAARQRGAAVSAVKFSKVTPDQIRGIRAAVPEIEIWHGSSRAIQSSLAAGADIVVSPPLAAMPTTWPAPTITAVQQVVDEVQRLLDARTDHVHRVRLIASMAAGNLRSSSVGLGDVRRIDVAGYGPGA